MNPTVKFALALDFVFLGIFILLFFRYTMRERRLLEERSSQTSQLQQRVYQIQVLKEISDRIGYSLDTNKIVEILTSSIGNLLDFDTVSYMVFNPDGSVVFRVHVEHTVNRGFIEDVKQKMLASVEATLKQNLKVDKLDESVTGNILDDTSTAVLASQFNLPVVIAGKLVGLINIASSKPDLYSKEDTAVLFGLTEQAGHAVERLQALLENEKGRLAVVINSMPDGVVMVTPENEILVSNPALNSLLGLGKDQIITMFDVVDALAGKVDIRTKIEEAWSKKQPVHMSEVFLLDHVVEVTITPVKGADGDHLGAVVVFHDVTSSKSLEKLRQEFTAMMVHELRAPLTAVRWAGEALAKSANAAGGLQAPKVAEQAQAIELASSNMLELVNDLLDVAKIEAGKFDLNVQEYDLADIVNQQVTIFRPLAESKHLQLEVTLPEHLKIPCDKIRVAQALENLLSNAIKYTDTGSVMVTLNLDNAKGVAVVGVKDSGVGVSKEDLSQLFSKFRQLKNTDNSRKGTGLGLVVSKGIVEAHGGQIWAESAGENLGTTFYFTLPIKH